MEKIDLTYHQPSKTDPNDLSGAEMLDLYNAINRISLSFYPKYDHMNANIVAIERKELEKFMEIERERVNVFVVMSFARRAKDDEEGIWKHHYQRILYSVTKSKDSKAYNSTTQTISTESCEEAMKRQKERKKLSKD